ncbi:MAG: S8 family serine peptidase [Methanosarcinaceae archaeon]
MKKLFLLLTLLLITLLTTGIFAQERYFNEESVNTRRNAIQSFEPPEEYSRAVNLAGNIGIPVRRVLNDGTVIEIRRINVNGNPEYIKTSNSQAAKVSGTDLLHTSYYGMLLGSGMVIGLWDAGPVRETHQEFFGRVLLMNDRGYKDGHSTHVAGTICASGKLNLAKGMAPGASVESYDWTNDILEMESAAKSGLLISNHSYGYVTGWNYNPDEEIWEWYGDSRVSDKEDYLFGYYHPDAREFDRIIYENPEYLIVKAAGNDRYEGPDQVVPHNVWMGASWVSSETEREIDGGESGYETMGPVSTAKNILTVGAVNDTIGFEEYSSAGPTDDGRIKPDIMGNGEGLISSYSESDDSYAISSGTSMAAPNVSGSLALLQQAYHQDSGFYMSAALLKGLVIHSATDIGLPGPDYKTGWGLLSSLMAILIIREEDNSRLREYTLQTGSEIRIRMKAKYGTSVKATICWTDPPGEVPEVRLDPVDKVLVNDLDIRIIRVSDGQQIKPWILDPMHPEKAAVTGDNSTDNVEQVFIGQPETGEYEIVISHKGMLEGGQQDFALVTSGLADSYDKPDYQYIYDNNGVITLTAEEYLPDMDVGWYIQPENGQPVKLFFDYFNTEEEFDYLAIYDGDSSYSPLLAILNGTPDTDTIEIASSTGNIFLHFVSNGAIQGTGFRLFYCTTPPEGSLTIEGNPYPCINDLATYRVHGTPGANYEWYASDNMNMSVIDYNHVTLNPGQDSGTLKVTGFNLCGASEPDSLIIQPVSEVPAVQWTYTDSLLCVGETGRVELTDIEGASYSWSLPDGWMGYSITNELEFRPSSDHGSIITVYGNACGTGDTLVFPINVKDIPSEGYIQASSDLICQDAVYDFSVDSVDSVDYSWDVAGDWILQDNGSGDSARIMTGLEPGCVINKARNECGVRNTIVCFEPTQKPLNPEMRSVEGSCENCLRLYVRNKDSYSQINWWRNGEKINSENAMSSSYITSVPGTYTVSVINHQGCELIQGESKGIVIDGDKHLFAAYPGRNGSVNVINASPEDALVKIFDLKGNLVLVTSVEPGSHQLGTGLKGVYIVNVIGSDKIWSEKVFLY